MSKADKRVQMDEPADVAFYPWDLTPPLSQKTIPSSVLLERLYLYMRSIRQLVSGEFGLHQSVLN